MIEDYEKSELFYLGKELDAQSMEITETLTLLKNKNFTTHAAIIGMTGSGKTGLGVGLIEEAALDNIPSIIIDPKGDMGNLCLVDPTFSSASFEPWVREEAKAKEQEPAVYAQKIATMWKEGLQSWNQEAQRVQTFYGVQKTIYTPGSSVGVAINILSSLDVPPSEVMLDSDTYASYLKSTATSLLSLVGVEADPMESKEYILLAQIITQSWVENQNLSIESIIGKIITPAFDKIGVLALDDFYPKEARFVLATKFNALLASPSFSLWLKGESLDIQKLLYDDEGKAKIAIFSISHLSDTERMFFVTLLLNKYIAWMRRQSGTATLKTLLYMDEIFGYFPPTKNPPSKEPMLLLLKQARAYGVGVVLSTQNPIDLDYKGLSNIGTWFIGRLQTTQDIQKVIDGLSGKIGSDLDKDQIKTLLTHLKERTFFIKSAHLDHIKLFTARWVMSYLKGPLDKDEISSLMQTQKEKQNITTQSVSSLAQEHSKLQSIQNIDASIPQYFEPDPSGVNTFTPNIVASAKIHFYQQTKNIDTQKELMLVYELDESQKNIVWEDAREEKVLFEQYGQTPPNGAQRSTLPTVVLEDKGLKKAISELEETLYRTQNLELFRCVSLKMESRVDETHLDFTSRVEAVLQAKKEEESEKLKSQYAQKENTLQERLSRTHLQAEKEASDSTGSMIEAGIAVLGALLGRSSSAKIGRAVSKGSRVLKERGDMSRVQEREEAIQEDITALQDELTDKIDALDEKYTTDTYPIETFTVRPKKSDIDVGQCVIVWRLAQ